MLGNIVAPMLNVCALAHGVAFALLMTHVAACTVVTQREDCGVHTCNASTARCTPCTADAQCWHFGLRCVAGDCVIAPLQHASVARTAGALGIALSVCAIASIAGVGGGGILVPAYNLVLGWPLANSVALSQATIAGMSIFSVGMKIAAVHPTADPPRFLINWTLLAFWLPGSLAGTMLGNIAGRVVPSWFRLGALFGLLSFVLYRVVCRLLAQRSSDRALARGRVLTADALLPVDASKVPYGSAVVIGGTFAALLAVNFTKSAATGVVECGSPQYWMLTCGIATFCMSVTLAVRHDLARGVAVTSAAEWSPLPFRWNRNTSAVFPALAVVAGAAASLLGIGGGLILSFLFLEAGLTPSEGSATSGAATLFVSVEALLQFLIQHEVPYDFCGAFFACGAVSALGGKVMLSEIERRGWSFLIIGALAVIMGGSMVALAIDGTLNILEVARNGGSLGFGRLC